MLEWEFYLWTCCQSNDRLNEFCFHLNEFRFRLAHNVNNVKSHHENVSLKSCRKIPSDNSNRFFSNFIFPHSRIMWWNDIKMWCVYQQSKPKLSFRRPDVVFVYFYFFCCVRGWDGKTNTWQITHENKYKMNFDGNRNSMIEGCVWVYRGRRLNSP
jgi:hypothetical protein